MLVLDSGGVTRLSLRDRQTAALLLALRRRGLWPASVVIAETAGAGSREAAVHRALKAIEVHDVDAPTGFAAARLRRAAAPSGRKQRDLTVDAVVATALALGPGTLVLTSVRRDLAALLDGSDVNVASL